jgi:hypothetical protein
MRLIGQSAMKYDRWFKFADKHLNEQLLSLVKKSAVPSGIERDGRILYRSEDEEAFEDLLAEVRDSVFSRWQVLSCPEDWVQKYRSALEDRGIEFQEELNNGAVEFLIPEECRPHRWKMNP